MKKNILFILIFLLIGILFFVLNQPFQAEAQPSRLTERAGIETWTFGVTSEGSATYANVAGRMITNVASFRANQAENEIFFIFPAAAEIKTVRAASVNLLSRVGDTPESVNLSLSVVDLDGEWLHSVSQPIDVLLLVPGSWVDLTLSDEIVDLQIQPGQVLVGHLSFLTQGDLDIKCIFDIEVE